MFKPNKKVLISWSSLTVFLFSLFIGLISPHITTAQNVEGEWINKAMIRVGNDIFRNQNSYDYGKRVFTASINGCGGEEQSSIDVTSSTKGSLVIYAPSPSDQTCYKKSTQEINIKDDGNSGVLFYKLSDDAILAAEGFTCQANSGTSIDSKSAALLGPTYYKKIPAEDPLVGALDEWIQKDVRDGKVYFRVSNEGVVNQGGNDFIIYSGGNEANQFSWNCFGSHIEEVSFLKDGGSLVDLPDWAPSPPPGIKLKDGTTPGGSPDDAASGNTTQTCESNNPTIIIGWVICAFINVLDNAVDGSTELVNDLLEFDTGVFKSGDEKSEQLRAAWSVFRAISSFALVGVVLVMILGQTLGGGN